MALGLPVPDGFVVTTSAYAAAKAAGDDDGAADPQVPSGLAEDIGRAYRRLGAGQVAVRSSATSEDLAGMSFAGQHDTFLGVEGEEALVDAVQRCWASLWSERAVDYRCARSIDEAGLRIAVVVQRMVAAEVAGVMFTADPVTGRRDRLIIEASTGLGEAVVSGRVTPDHYELDPGAKVVTIRPGDSTASAGCLGQESLARLHRLGSRAAEHYRAPQDLEWAICSGELSILQCRPMTAVPTEPVALNHIQRLIGARLTEYLPVRPYPLDTSSWLPYGPAGQMLQVAASYGITGVFDSFLALDELGVVVAITPGMPRPTRRLLTLPFRLILMVGAYDPARWTRDPRYRAFVREVNRLAAVDVAALGWHKLISLPRAVLAAGKYLADLRTDYLPGVGLALLRLKIQLIKLGRGADFADLTHGGPTRTQDANVALNRLADLVACDDRLRSAVGTGDVATVQADPAFGPELAAFLAEYGHRETSSPILMSPPTLAEMPEAVLSMLSLLSRPQSGPASPSGAKPDPLQKLLRHPRLTDPARRTRVERTVLAARAGLAFREDTHFAFTRPLPLLRAAVLEIGRRLTATGVFARPSDILHLQLEEIEALADPATAPVERFAATRTSVTRRRDRRAEYAGAPLISPLSLFPPRRNVKDALVTGSPTSSGRATGPARIVLGPDEFGNLQPGDVLVCPYTNPSWTPLFQRAAAVVVDIGGPGSHAAIVAREYGIPAVMGCGDATRTLVDGQLIMVDGSAGTVAAAPSQPPT